MLRALASVGFNGNLTIFSRFKGVADFVDNHRYVWKKDNFAS